MSSAWRCVTGRAVTEGEREEEFLEALQRLARALGTTVEDLMLRAPASWLQPVPDESGQPLDVIRCRTLLESSGVGRVGFCGESGPMVLPVNFVLAGGRIVFRTSRHSSLATLDGARVVFEVDQIDHEHRSGWSVVVSGFARVVHEASADLPCAVPESWAGGARDVFVVIDADRITGRRVGAEPVVSESPRPARASAVRSILS